MRILSLCLSESLGGLELYALRSALSLSSDNDVAFVTSKAGKLTEKLPGTDIQTFYIHPTFRPYPLLSAFRLARLIDRLGIEILHMHWGKDLALASLAVKISRTKPALIYTRQMQITRKKTDFYHQHLYKEMNLMLTITQLLKEKCQWALGDKYSNRVRHLYYGVPEPDIFYTRDQITSKRSELGFDDNDFIAGLFGRLEDYKGQHILIKAIADARSEGVTIKALIVGHEMDHGYRDTLSQLAESYDVTNNITFMDFVSKPQLYMQLCDCVVLATYEETFGLVLPEAMRAGVAVIGSNAGGVPEIIEHGRTGLLFETRNTEDLKKQLITLYKDPSKKTQLAQNGRASADDMFNHNQHYRELAKIFSQYVKSCE